MTLSPPIDDRPDTRYSCWLAAGSDQARIGLLNWPAVTPSIRSCNVRSTLSTDARTSVHHAKAIASTAALQPQKAQTRGEIPIAPAAPSAHHPPRFRALALFGRRPPERVEGFVIAGSRKPAQNRTHAPRKRSRGTQEWPLRWTHCPRSFHERWLPASAPVKDAP